MTLETTEELLEGLVSQVALQNRLKEYEFVIANLIQQAGGQVTVPILKFEGLTGELIDLVPVITVAMDNERSTFTMSIDQRFPVPAASTPIPTMQSYRYSDEEAMSYAGVVKLLKYLLQDYRDRFGQYIEEGAQIEAAIKYLENDSCLMKAKPGEPIFAFLGRDFAAPHAIISWLACRREARIPTEWNKKENALKIANQMMSYPGRIMPPGWTANQ